MNAVIKQFAQEEAAQLEADQRRYALLLENDKPSPAEVDELRELMRRLNKTSEMLQHDHRIIQDAIAAEQRIRNGTSLDEQIQAAERAKNAHYTETENVIKQRDKELRELGAKSSALQSTKSAAQDSYHNLEKMVHLHPDLLRFRKVLPKP